MECACPSLLCPVHYPLRRVEVDPDQRCACGADTPEGEHERSAYCTSEWGCGTCGDDPRNTPGGILCKECGLEGTMPWGG